MVFGGGRSSNLVSHADNRAATFDEHHHDSPLKALKRMGDKLKHHTAVTNTEEEPGVTGDEQPAGTSLPIAQRANKESLNAGFHSSRDDAQSMKGGRRSFSSFRSFRSRSSMKTPGTPRSSRGQSQGSSDSPSAAGTTSEAGTKAHMSKEQQKAMNVAENPQKHLQKAGEQESANRPSGQQQDKRKPRLANTETFYQPSEEQTERERKVREHLQNAPSLPQSSPYQEKAASSTATANAAAAGEATADHGKDGQAAISTDVPGAENVPHRSQLDQADATDDKLSIVRTASQPSPEAVGSLSPRNRFVGTGGVRGEQNGMAHAVGMAPQNRQTQADGDVFNGPKGSQEFARAHGLTGAPDAAGAPYGSEQNRFFTPPTSVSNLTEAPSHAKNAIAGGTAPRAGAHVAAPNGSAAHADGAADFGGSGDATTTTTTRASTEDEQQYRTADHDQPGSAVGAATNAEGKQEAAGPDEQKEVANDDVDEEGEDEHADYGDDGTHGKTDNQDVYIPEGSVPGLGIGDEDPRLPGERPAPKKSQPSPDLESEKTKKKFLEHKEEVRKKRERQAEYSGWRQIGGWDKRTRDHTRQEAEDLLEKSTVLESYVSDKYLGDWYQNTAIIVFTAFFSWFLGWLNFSVSWISLVLLFTATAYRTSVRRMRRNYRDDVLRESLLERHQDNDSESMEWLNSFMIKFWLIYEPSLSQMITEIGNEILAEQTPGFIDSMKLDKFTLGTKAPRIDFVRSFPRTQPNVVVIDMGASFTPNDTMDLTARQLQTKVNPKVQLGVRVGKGFLTKNFPVLLEDMNFKGKFRVRLKLMERPPHIQTLDFSFLAPPEFDFVLKPIGGDKLGFDVNIIPGLSKFIKDMVHANLGPMMYAPNAFQLDIEQLMAGVGVNSGVGVLSLQIIEAKDLKIDADGRVDPYVMVLDKNKKQLARTKIKSNTTSPVWHESINVIITNTNDNVLIEVFDFDESSPDRSIGQAPIKVDELQGSEIVETPITSGGRRTGCIKYIAHYAPVNMPSEDDNKKGTSPRDTKSGILSLKVAAARDLDPTSSKTAKLSPYAEFEFSGRLIDSTKVAKDTNDPEWNYGAEHIVLDKLSTLFTIRIRDKRGKGSSPPQVGLFKVKLSQLLVEAEKGNVWFPLDDGKGEIKIEPQWKPVNITVGGSTNNYVEPIGVVRMKILNAKNLRNLEHIGKIDPYARVFVGRRLIARTEWFKNELNPVWNETLYLPVQSELQDLTIEVMDVENHAKDRSLGAFKINLQNVIKSDEDGNYKVFISDKTFTNKLMLPNRGPKGTLEYTMEFYPSIPIVSPEEKERIHSDLKLIEILKKKVEEKGGDVKSLSDKERRELAVREERLDFSGVDMPIEDQLKYDAGIFAVAIVSLEGHHTGQSLKVVANNSPYAMFTSPVFQSTKRYSSEECPDFVSGQMKLSSVRFELGTFGTKSDVSGTIDVDEDHDEESVARDPHAAEITISCCELIRDASMQPKSYTMRNGAKIELQARFLPLPGLIIDDEEDISNTGSIEVDLQRAEGVAAADRTGLSDPYTAFYLNNDSDKVYKSKVQKGTLDPVWNEQFRFGVDNVSNSFVKAIVNDWDMGNRDDFLGGYRFDLNELEPLVWKDYQVSLEKIKKNREVRHTKEVPGTLYLRLRFLPGHLQKSGDKYLIGASSVSKAAGGLASAGMGGIGAAAHKPHALLDKITHHGHKEQKKFEEAAVSFSAQIEGISGLDNYKNEVQVRCYLLDANGEKEIFRSHGVKLENGEATFTDTFEFKSLPESELGVKVLALKSLGRTSDIAQSSTDLEPGLKEIRITKDAVLRLSVSKDE